MGRPKATDRSAPEKMRQTFWNLLESKPYDRITVTDVVHDARINRSAFYYHYNDIDELAEDAISATCSDPHLARMLADVITSYDPSSGSEQRLATIISSSDYRMRLERIALATGPHGSAKLTAKLREFIQAVWRSTLGIDPASFDTSQKLVFDFATNGMLGILGELSGLLDSGDISWTKDFPLPMITSVLFRFLNDKPSGGMPPSAIPGAEHATVIAATADRPDGLC